MYVSRGSKRAALKFTWLTQLRKGALSMKIFALSLQEKTMVNKETNYDNKILVCLIQHIENITIFCPRCIRIFFIQSPHFYQL